MWLRPRCVAGAGCTEHEPVAGRNGERRSCGYTQPPLGRACANVTCCEESALIDAVECEASVEVVLRCLQDGFCSCDAD